MEVSNSLYFGTNSFTTELKNDNREPMGPETFDKQADTKIIYQFLVGKDSGFPHPMTEEEVKEKINDPFAKLILRRNIYPVTLSELVKELDKTKSSSLEGKVKKIEVSHIAEGGKISWNELTAKVNRTFRLVFSIKTEKETSNGKEGLIFIGSGTNVDSEKTFLEVMGWDQKNGCFNFYQRLSDDKSIKRFWIYSGGSYDALVDPTRKKGPFSGHINGGPVMKELKIPWQHWSSNIERITANIFSLNDPFRNHPFFTCAANPQEGEIVSFKEAYDFENTIKAAMTLINSSRIKKGIDSNNKVEQFSRFLRQILDTENLNLTSSGQRSNDSDPVLLPITFFLNSEAFGKIMPLDGIESLLVSREIYKKSLEKFDFHLESNGIKIQEQDNQPRDTFFAFFVPEPAAEDIDLLQRMIKKEMISSKLAACLLMVDFSNPIFSNRRKSLIKYIPETVIVGNQGKDLDVKFLENVTKSDPIKGTPEEEFLNHWNTEDWQNSFKNKIQDYWRNLKEKLQSEKEYYHDIVRLAEFRRALFRKTALYEFPLTFAMTNIDSSIPLEITPKGEIREISRL